MIPGRGIIPVEFFPSSPIGLYNIACQGSQMPFTKMPCSIAPIFDHFPQSNFLGFYMTTIGMANSIAKRMSSRHYTSTCWGTYGRRRIETFKNSSIGSHGIQIRSFKMRMAVIRHISPTLVIGHQQYDVRGWVFCWTDFLFFWTLRTTY